MNRSWCLMAACVKVNSAKCGMSASCKEPFIQETVAITMTTRYMNLPSSDTDHVSQRTPRCLLPLSFLTSPAPCISEHELSECQTRSSRDTNTEVHIFFGSRPLATMETRGCSSCDELMRAFGPHYDDPRKKLTIVSNRTEFGQAICVSRLGS